MVLDAGCLSLHFIADPRLRRHFDEIEDEAKMGHVSSVNLSEFYYKTCQSAGRHAADLRYYQLRRTKVQVVETDEQLTRAAGLEKCRQPHRLSLADCYALSLAKKLKATLLTTDGELAKTKDVKTLHFKP